MDNTKESLTLCAPSASNGSIPTEQWNVFNYINYAQVPRLSRRWNRTAQLIAVQLSKQWSYSILLNLIPPLQRKERNRFLLPQIQTEERNRYDVNFTLPAYLTSQVLYLGNTSNAWSWEQYADQGRTDYLTTKSTYSTICQPIIQILPLSCSSKLRQCETCCWTRGKKLQIPQLIVCQLCGFSIQWKK